MPFSIEILTVEDFTSSEWETIVEEAEEKDCLCYMTAFRNKASEAIASDDEKIGNLFHLIADLASMFIDADDLAEPLKPMFQGNNGRSAIPSDFDPALDYLTKILPHIDNPELRARVADVLWLRKRDFKAAREAVIAYLSGVQFQEGQHWTQATDRIERAIDIAARTNQRDLLDEVYHRIEKVLGEFSGSENSFLPVRLMKILLNRKIGDPTRYATLAEALAISAESRSDWHQAREYWGIQAEWYKLAQDEEGQKAASLRGAETYIREAESRLEEEPGQGYMVAAHFLEQAIQSLRAIGNQKERINELHCQLLEYQRQGVSEGTTHSHEYDASAMIVAATKAVSGRALYDAIFGLALLGQPPSIENLRGQAEVQRKNSIASLFPVSFTNGMGRTVARRPAIDLGEAENEADLRMEMYRNGSLSQLIHVQGMIGPAIAQILREHEVRVDDLLPLVRDNPFVPRGREQFFAQGLHAGFKRDFVSAVHLLVPQLENSIRFILEQRDINASGLDHHGIQDEYDLNRTLCTPEFADPLKKVLGEDLVFDLRGLLVERYGSNLRNDMAHGLLDYEAFHSAPCVYCWWLTLRLCCIPVITSLTEEQQNEEEEANGSSEVQTRSDPFHGVNGASEAGKSE